MIRNNKRGQLTGAIYGVLGILLIIVIAVALIYRPFLNLIFGIGSAVILFITFINIIKDGKVKGKEVLQKMGLAFAIIGISAFFVYGGFGLISQTALGQSSITTVDGKTAWVWSATIGDVDETFIFNGRPSDYTNPNTGVKVQPQQDLKLTMVATKSYCAYSTTAKTKTSPSFLWFGGNEVTYWTLRNPERVLEYSIKDNFGNDVRLDGASGQEAVFLNHNGGSAKVQSQGFLGGTYDCPNYQDIAVLKNEDTGKYVFVDKDIAQSGSVSTLLRIATGGQIDTVGQDFVGDMEGTYFDATLSKVFGGIDLGRVVVTITADEDYFESTVIDPAKGVIPLINDTNLPSKISAESDSSLTVDVKNTANDDGSMILTVSSPNFGISPGTYTDGINAGKTKTYSFQLDTGSSLGKYPIEIKACGSSQFSSTVCDTKTIFAEIVAKDTIEDKCGDGFCDSSRGETVQNCANDCYDPQDTAKDNQTLQCSWYESYKEVEQVDYDWYNYIGFGEPERTLDPTCVTSGWVYALIFGIIGGVIIIVITVVVLKSAKKPKRGNK